MEIDDGLPHRHVVIVVDGANVGHAYSAARASSGFVLRGVELAVALFRRRGHEAFAMLPARGQYTQDAAGLAALVASGVVTMCPAHDSDGVWVWRVGVVWCGWRVVGDVGGAWGGGCGGGPASLTCRWRGGSCCGCRAPHQDSLH